MREPVSRPAPRRRLFTAKRLLAVGLAGAVVVTAGAVANAQSLTGLWSSSSSGQYRSSSYGNSYSSYGSGYSSFRLSSSSYGWSNYGGQRSYGYYSSYHGSRYHSGYMGSWGGFRIVLPAAVAPPAGSRLVGIVIGKGVVTFTCTTGQFNTTDSAMNLFAVSHSSPAVGIEFGAPTLSFSSTRDGSRVDANVVQQVANNTGKMPPALLQAVANRGPGGLFGQAKFLVQLPLSSGRVPATCTTGGARLVVPVLAAYLVFTTPGGTTTLPGTTTTTPTPTPTTGALNGTTNGTTTTPQMGTHW